jgi:tRNA(Arg) A34 adenosine deaminase TadA
MDDEIVCTSHTQVIGRIDPSAHAEIEAIRNACSLRRNLDLSGAQLYVTVEPCAMCLAACSYAGIDQVFYGAPISAMNDVTGNEVPAGELLTTQLAIVISGGLLAEESMGLIQEWATAKRATST